MVETILSTFIAVVIVLAVRNELIYRIRVKAIDFIYAQENWLELRSRLDRPSYGAMIFDLTRWSYTAFYPDFRQ